MITIERFDAIAPVVHRRATNVDTGHMYSLLGPNEDGTYTAWDHEAGTHLADRDGVTGFIQCEDAWSLVLEFAANNEHPAPEYWS